MKPDWQTLFAAIDALNPGMGFVSPSLDETKDRIAFIKAQFDLIRPAYEELEKENAQLKEQLANLKLNPERSAPSDDFVEHRGALFKRLAPRRYSDQPICPKCHSVMHSLQDVFPFECVDPKCKRTAAFTGDDLKRILSELP